MANELYDVLIAGAGPAGCTAAISLAYAGLSVAVAEKSSSTGGKVCGDALSGTVMNVLKRLPGDAFQDFNQITDKIPSWGIRFYAPSGQSLDIPFATEVNPSTPVPGYICKRENLDDFLRQQMKKHSGIRLFDGFGVEEIKKDHSGITISGMAGSLSGKVLIGADGVNSKVAKSFSDTSSKNICLGVRAYYRGISDLPAHNFIELHFLEELLPGYLWIFPMYDGLANVGLGMMTQKAKKLKYPLAKLLDDLINNHPQLKERFKGAVKEGSTGAHILPLGPPAGALSSDRIILTGDAAKLVDPFTGEGIGNAMISGEVAASVAAEAIAVNDLSADFLKRYDQRIRMRLSPELETSRKIQQLVNYGWLFNFVVRQVNRKPARTELFTKMYTDMEVRKKLGNPMFYLELLFG